MSLERFKLQLDNGGFERINSVLRRKNAFTTPSSAIDFEYEWVNLDAYGNYHHKNLSCIFDRFNLDFSSFRDTSVLDVGCGNGRLGSLLIDLCTDFVGIEPSTAAKVFADYLIDRGYSSDSCVIIQDQLDGISNVDFTFDFVLCWGVLHHVKSPRDLLRSMLNRLSKDGVLLLYIYPPFFRERGEFAKVMSKQTLGVKEKFVAAVSDIVDFYGMYGDELASIVSDSLFCGRYSDSEMQKFQLFDGVTPLYHWDLQDKVSIWTDEFGFYVEMTAPGCFKISRSNNN